MEACMYSSRVTRFNVLLALCITNFPVAIEPVKLILSIPGWLVIHGPRLSSPLRHCKTPGGKIAMASSASLRSQYGVYGLVGLLVSWSLGEKEGRGAASAYEGFKIMTLPVRSAGAIFPVASKMGKFHGTIAPTTPSGVYCASPELARYKPEKSSCPFSRVNQAPLGI